MRYDQISPVPPLTKVTRALIIICVVMFFVDFTLTKLGIPIMGLSLNEILGLVPALVRDRYWVWQFVTYIFMHGHHFHLLLNMLILWFFGAEIELRMGERGFLKYFLFCGIGAGVFNFLVNILFVNEARLMSPIIGASGAIYGILAAYGIFFANRYLLVFFLFPMKAKYYILLIAGIELITGAESNPNTNNVAHFAHIGGMALGALYIYLAYIRTSGSRKGGKRDAERERLKKQFTLIVNQNSSDPPKEEKGPFWN